MNNSAKRIALLYFCISAIWIYTSDMVFESVFSNLTSQQKYIFSVLKGICFVSITTILLYKLINKYYHSLQTSEEEYKAMFDSNPNPMWIYDPETLAFIKANQATSVKYGYSKKDLLTMKVTDIRSPEEAQRFKEYIANNIDVKGFSGIWLHTLRDGSSIHIEAYADDIIYHNKKAKLILALDITDKINYEKQLAQQQKALETANAQLEITIKELEISKEKIYSTQKIARIAGWTYILEKDLFKLTPGFYELLKLQETTNHLITLLDVENFICEDDLPKLRYFMKQFKNGDKQGECVLRLRDKGNWKFIKFGALLTSDNAGQVLEGFIQDITRLELKDQLIKTTLERFEHLATATKDAFYEWDYQHNLIRWSGNVDYLIGGTDTKNFQKEEWWIERVHPEDFSKSHNLLIEALTKGQERLTREYRFKDEKGHYILLYDQAIIKYDEQKRVVKIIGSLHDIEEITKVNRENKRLGEIVNKVKNLIIITNKEGYTEWVNAAFLERTGYSWYEVKGRKPLELFNYPSSSEEAVLHMNEAMSNKKYFNIEVENIMKDGSISWYQIDGNPIYDDKNNYEGYIAIESDITERKVKEEKIKLQNKLLKKSAWINSHQVRKPLASILGLIQLMQLSNNEKETEEYLSLLEICSNELDAIIKKSVDLTDIKK